MKKYPVALVMLVISLIVGCLSMQEAAETEMKVSEDTARTKDAPEVLTSLGGSIPFYSPIEALTLVENGADANLLIESDSNVRRQHVYAADPSIKFGVTPIMISTDEEMTRRLIELGADVNVRTSKACNGVSDMTPLMFAQDAGSVKALLDAGASAFAKTNRQQTVLMYIDDPQALKLLVDRGVDVNAKDVDGRTALMYLASHPTCDYCDVYFDGSRSLASMKTLLELGADIHAIDNSGANALMYAAADLNLENMRLLIDAGIDVNALDHEGKNVLSYIGKFCEDSVLPEDVNLARQVLEKAISNK